MLRPFCDSTGLSTPTCTSSTPPDGSAPGTHPSGAAGAVRPRTSGFRLRAALGVAATGLAVLAAGTTPGHPVGEQPGAMSSGPTVATVVAAGTSSTATVTPDSSSAAALAAMQLRQGSTAGRASRSTVRLALTSAAVPSAAAATSTAAGVSSAQAIARTMLAQRGWSGQWTCLNALWKRESGWRSTASNPSSGAYGIPQALPGRKMASAGRDWRTSAATQIRWGLRYITARYGTPCRAWAHSRATGWY